MLAASSVPRASTRSIRDIFTCWTRARSNWANAALLASSQTILLSQPPANFRASCYLYCAGGEINARAQAMTIRIPTGAFFASGRARASAFGGIGPICLELPIIRHQNNLFSGLQGRRLTAFLKRTISSIPYCFSETRSTILDVSKRPAAPQLCGCQHPVNTVEICRRNSNGLRLDSGFVQLQFAENSNDFGSCGSFIEPSFGKILGTVVIQLGLQQCAQCFLESNVHNHRFAPAQTQNFPD